LEVSDRASIYGDKRTMEKDSNKGMRVPMDVWYGKYWGRVQGNNKERRSGHQNQIPEAYLERVILACSNKGDLVLDPFAGSGTTGTVARAYDRRSIGIEQSEQTATSAWQRMTEAGMCRKGEAIGQSTAIFSKRSGKKT
jgi:DNA modification methylase